MLCWENVQNDRGAHETELTAEFGFRKVHSGEVLAARDGRFLVAGGYKA